MTSITIGSSWPVLLLGGLFFLWWMGRQTETRLSAKHLNLLLAVRSAMMVMLALALMRPVWQRPGRWLSVVFALDVSKSISPSFIDSTLKWILSAVDEGKPDHARFIAFASRALVVEEAEDLATVPVSRGGAASAGALDQSETDIEQALNRALTSFEPRSLRRLVLITDGRETKGDASRAIERAEREGVRVYTVPAEVRAETDSWIEEVVVPEGMRAGEPFEVTVRVFSRAPQAARLELEPTGVASSSLTSKALQLPAGLSQVPFKVRFQEPGRIDIEARLTAERDRFPENNRQRQSIWLNERPKILYVEGHPESARYLEEALENEGFDVARAISSKVPPGQALEAYDGVILSDVPADSLDERKMQSLADYVGDGGGGLIFIGGEMTYGASGYSQTPLEDALPISFRVQEKRKDVALVITLDKSFSMDGEKIELAKEASKAALDLLDESHFFGLVTFDWYPHVTVPLQLAIDKEGIRDTIGRIEASAPTRIFPALEEAYRQLSDNESKVKHIILLSDGMSYRQEDGGESQVSQMTQDRITISTIAVGQEVDRELLQNIAQWGNGRTYFTEDAERVPEIFIRETEIAVQDSLVEEPIRLKRLKSAEAFAGIDFDAAPPLRGHIGAQPKPTSEVLLESESGAPVLARWNYGLGKAVAFTSDAKNRWARDWLTWEGYGKFWAQLTRETMRRQNGNQLDLKITREGNDAAITLEATDGQGRFLNGLEPQIHLTGPEGSESTQPVGQVGPGSYRVEIPLALDPDAPTVFDLNAPIVPTSERNEIRSGALYYPFSDEYRFLPPHTGLLLSMSQRTGAKAAPRIEDIFADLGDTVTRPVPLWPYLAGLALVLYLLDIGIRRAPWMWNWFQQHG